jgi:hypothetical protein
MDYSLSFQAKNPAERIPLQKIKDYFKERQNFSINDFQALYSNRDTGIFFTFEFGGHKEAGNSSILAAVFKISYGKPHIFVLEAESELGDFIRNFDLKVSDPYGEQGGYQDYAELDFYKGWNSGNEEFYKEVMKDKKLTDIYSLPVALMEKIWRWNYHVAEMQAEQGKELFIPKVLMIDYQGVLYTAAVWTDGQPVALPRVEKLILYRRSMAHGFHIGQHEDIALSDFNTLEPLLKGYPLDKESLGYYTLIYTSTPAEIKHFVQTSKAVKSEDLKFVDFAEIYDRELAEKIIKEKNPKTT